MRSGFLPDRIIHLYPTRLCNLACLHCYSGSGLDHRSALDVDMLVQALQVLKVLKAEGYTVISLSGGEPLVYRPLHALLVRVKELGFRVTMVSNGLLVNARKDATLDLLDGMAISFDGLEATHDRIRARAGTFKQASAALERLVARGRPVAAAISLTREAIPELPELADHLAGLGARALQVRPVAHAGRARMMEGFSGCTPADLLRLYLVALAPAQGLWARNEAYVVLLGGCDVVPLVERPLADPVNPLIITDAGVLKPIAYDFNARFDIAGVEGLTSEVLRRYKADGLGAFRSLLGSVLAGMRYRQDLVDWFDHCARMSESVEA